jgi:hypothetical protein
VFVDQASCGAHVGVDAQLRPAALRRSRLVAGDEVRGACGVPNSVRVSKLAICRQDAVFWYPTRSRGCFPFSSRSLDAEGLESVVLGRDLSARHVGAHPRRRPVGQCEVGAGERVDDVVVADVRVPETRFALDHAAILYSWMRPPSRSRRRT